MGDYKIKFIKKANMWGLFIQTTERGKDVQKTSWHITKEQAEEHLKELQDEEDKIT